jgi:hypothetical protein
VPFSSFNEKNPSASDFQGPSSQRKILSGSGDSDLVRLEWGFPEIYNDLCLLSFSDFHQHTFEQLEQGCGYLGLV